MAFLDRHRSQAVGSDFWIDLLFETNPEDLFPFSYI